MNNRHTLFALKIKRVPLGYRAQAVVATRCGYITFCTTVRRHDIAVGETAESPKTIAMKSALEQASEFAASPQGSKLVPSRAKAAIAATTVVREVVERAQDGDSEARVGMRKLKHSPSKMVRKAVHAQRLFEE